MYFYFGTILAKIKILIFSIARFQPPILPHLVVVNLSLQFLDVIGGDRTVLNDAMCLFYQPLEVLYFLFILFILQHCLLETEIFT